MPQISIIWYVVFISYISCGLNMYICNHLLLIIPGLMRLYCVFGFVVREIPFCSIVFDATWAPWRQKSVSYLLFVQQHAVVKNKNRYPNSITGNAIFVTDYSWIYESTHADVWFCRLRNLAPNHYTTGAPHLFSQMIKHAKGWTIHFGDCNYPLNTMRPRQYGCYISKTF